MKKAAEKNPEKDLPIWARALIPAMKGHAQELLKARRSRLPIDRLTTLRWKEVDAKDHPVADHVYEAEIFGAMDYVFLKNLHPYQLLTMESAKGGYLKPVLHSNIPEAKTSKVFIEVVMENGKPQLYDILLGSDDSYTVAVSPDVVTKRFPKRMEASPIQLTVMELEELGFDRAILLPRV